MEGPCESTIGFDSCVLIAIVVLYAIESGRTRLVIIALLTALFAANVGILTNARRTELFAVTAGYAAVLIGFVSGNIGTEQGGRG